MRRQRLGLCIFLDHRGGCIRELTDSEQKPHWPARAKDHLTRLRKDMPMLRAAVAAIAALTTVSNVSLEATAQTVLKIGAVQSMTGPFDDTGKGAMDGARLYLREHGDVFAGRNLEIIAKDDASLPDAGKRLAQELIVNDKVALLLGGITPSALSIAPLTADAKLPMIVFLRDHPSRSNARLTWFVRASRSASRCRPSPGGQQRTAPEKLLPS
jgi:ABC-type branched-subunit amino acid transport system substrate-binding protein